MWYVFIHGVIWKFQRRLNRGYLICANWVGTAFANQISCEMDAGQLHAAVKKIFKLHNVCVNCAQVPY